MNKPEVRSAAKSAAPQPEGTRKVTREDLAKQIKKMRDRDAELVTGVFKNLENPASSGSRGSLVFSYKMYHGEENVIYELLDGERYRLPRGVARHLNNNCFYREYQHLPGEFGQQGIRGGVSPDGRLQTNSFQQSRKVHRYAFHSLDYMDDDVDMYPSSLVEVTVSP
jgi:hypothetical protein